jgi:hypothetical protein
MRNSKHLARNTKTHYVVWYSIVAFNILVSFVIACGIPIFGSLLSLIGALLGSCECLRPWKQNAREKKLTNSHLLDRRDLYVDV